MAEYPNREVFPRAPLEYVACGLQFPLTPRLGRETALEELTDRFASTLPIPQVETVASVTLGPGESARTENEPRFRFLDRSRTRSIVVGRNALFVETTNYSEYPEFRKLVRNALTAVAEMSPVVGVERVGLRYIDEIRVPVAIDTVTDWSGWITDDILGAANVCDGFDVAQMETSLRIGTNGRSATVRYAALKGQGVVGNQPLRRRSSPGEGPFFLIDIDSYWNRDTGDMVDFDPDHLLELLDELHRPIGVLFHRSITENLREEFRKQ